MFALAKRFRRVYAIDLPGNGFSPLPASGPLSLQQHVDVIKAFLRDVVGEPAFLVGNSLGGAMAITVAHQAPERVKALGLVAPAGARVTEERLAALIKAMSVTSYSEAWSLTRRLFHRAPVGSLLFLPELRRIYGTPAVRAVFAEAATAADFLQPHVLESLPMPTVLIWGESEKLLPFESIDYFRTHLPRHAEIDVVRGFGHVPQVERPRQLVGRLVEFADRAGI
jgi:pimeloyl-ACP methyl ester carboxylesterase